MPKIGNLGWANFIIAGSAAFFAFGIVYAVARSGVHAEGLFVSVYIGFGFITVVLISCLALPRTIKSYLSICLVSIFAATYAAELYLTVTQIETQKSLRRHFLAKAAEEAGQPFDKRSGRVVLQALRDEGLDIYPVFSSGALGRRDSKDIDGIASAKGTVLPLGTMSDTLSLVCNESGSWLKLTTDEYGFNNPKGLYRPDTVDVLLIGDSFTFGYCVPRPATIAGGLRAQGLRTISLGQGGNGPIRELASLQEYGAWLRPPVVVLLYFERNDLFDFVYGESKSETLLSYLDPGFTQDLRNRTSEIDDAIRAQLELLDGFRVKQTKAVEERSESPVRWRQMQDFAKLLQLRVKVIHSKDIYDVKPDWKLLERALIELKHRVAGWDGKLYIVYLPEWDRFGDDRLDDLGLYNRGLVMSMFEKLDLQMIDFLELMRSHPDPLSIFPFRRDAHYNEHGYELVVKAITERLKADGTYPGSP